MRESILLSVLHDLPAYLLPSPPVGSSGEQIYFRGTLIAYKTQRQSVKLCTVRAKVSLWHVVIRLVLSKLWNLISICLMVGGIGAAPPSRPGVCVDNQSAIRIARNEVIAQGSKHVKLRHIRVTEQQRRLFFVPTNLQEADAFTKSLGEAIFAMMAL